jgi:nitroimidazol reductase NimA-like FMN-containing flavoprotein (pyridoxamine 5'-phosphate oxidase superfamily)
MLVSLLRIAYSVDMSIASNNPDITQFLKRNHVGVLATAALQGAQPHAAAVYYATDSSLNIYFLTKDKTTKSRNLESNPQAAVVIYEAETQRTAQIQGLVNKVEDKTMMEKALPLMSRFSKQTAGTEDTPISKLEAGEYVLYRLVPQFIRVGEYKYGTKNDLFEVAAPSEESLG